ncbi:hypothetical protein ACFWVH_43970, partial [Streptomyces sp. NPDC058656]
MPLRRVRVDRRGRRQGGRRDADRDVRGPPADRGGGGMREFGYQRVFDVSGAVALLDADPDARFLGGGTNLVDLMKTGVE